MRLQRLLIFAALLATSCTEHAYTQHVVVAANPARGIHEVSLPVPPPRPQMAKVEIPWLFRNAQVGVGVYASTGGSAATPASYVQSCATSTLSGSATSLTCTSPTSTNIGSGDPVLVCIQNYANGLTSPTFSSFLGSATNANLQGQNIGLMYGYCYIFTSNTGGSDAVTVSTGGSLAFSGMTWVELVAGSVDVQDTSSAATGNSTTPTGASITTTQNGDIIVSYVMGSTGASATVSAGAGFTLGANCNTGCAGGQLGSEYQVQATAGAIAPAFVFSPAESWLVWSIALKHP